ncbi:MAG: flagellar export chaperone FliS [Thermodesulfovibrionales bacterium]
MNAYAKNAYAASKVSNAQSPLDLVILLYDGAIERLRKATFHIGRKDMPAKIRALNGAMAIIEELLFALNVGEGGDVAGNLQNLYIHMLRELAEANLKNDVGKLRRVEALLSDLGEAWRQLKSQGHGGQA